MISSFLASTQFSPAYRLKLLVIALTGSVLLHVGIVEILFENSDQNKPVQSTINLTLAPSSKAQREPQQTSQPSRTQPEGSISSPQPTIPQPSSHSTQTGPQENSAETSPSSTTPDASLPYQKNSSRESESAFGELRRLSATKPKLSWVSEIFGQQFSGEEVAIEEFKAAEDQIRAMPSTQSSFWPYLVKHLAKNQYHQINTPLSQLTSKRMVVLRLSFNKQGILTKAAIARSSGDSGLDQAAIRSAYAANPYQPPPPQDKKFRFTYLVQIVYDPGSQRR